MSDPAASNAPQISLRSGPTMYQGATPAETQSLDPVQMSLNALGLNDFLLATPVSLRIVNKQIFDDYSFLQQFL